MRQYKTEAEFESKGADSDNVIDLAGYEVLVHVQRGGAPIYGFTLSSLGKSSLFAGQTRRDRHFRVESEEELRAWVSALVAASMVAQ